MFVDLSLSHTGDVVCMRLFDKKINDHDWGVFKACYLKMLKDVPKFAFIIDTTDASIYAPRWIKKFVKLMVDTTPQTRQCISQFVVVVDNDTIRKMINTIVKMNESERNVWFVKTTQQALEDLTTRPLDIMI